MGPFSISYKIMELLQSTLGTQNGVAERRNKTFIDMFRSMMITCNLLESLLRKALKLVAFILNRIPSKRFQKHL